MRAISTIGNRSEVESPEPAPSSELPKKPLTRELWKALIRAEEEALPEVEISGLIERDHLSGAVKIPYTTTGEPLDFDPEDAIEVLQEVEGELRKIGELNNRETTLTALVVEKPFRVPNRIGRSPKATKSARPRFIHAPALRR